MSEFRITKAQKAYLKSLVCQRISKDEANQQIIENFKNSKSSPGIINALKNGWNADKKDKIAFYIVKDPKDNQPLLFFSLKCGEIHLPLVPEKLDQSVRNGVMLLKAAALKFGGILRPRLYSDYEVLVFQDVLKTVLEIAQDMEVEDWAKDVIEKQLEDGILPEDAWNDIWRRIIKSLIKQDDYNIEMALEGENIIRTKKTFAAVELMHFCVHEPARKKWESMGMGRSLGKTLFWNSVEPVIRSIRDLVGCEYFYLFAADQKKEGKLTRYYRELGFDFRDDINVTKPMYDFRCYFMCQEVTALRTRKNEFLREFNNPVDPHKIK